MRTRTGRIGDPPAAAERTAARVVPRRRRMRLATRALLLQLGTVILVVALCTGVYLALAVQQLRAEAQSSALAIARTLAEDPQIRADVALASAGPGTPSAPALRDGSLQRTALAVMHRTGALFVVLTDDHGVRLSHPDPDRLGEQVSTPFREVLAGKEVVEWDTGTLGESARAKVPVRNATGTPVGEVSVGFARAGVFDDLRCSRWSASPPRARSCSRPSPRCCCGDGGSA